MIKFYVFVHQDKERLCIEFPRNAAINSSLKSVKGARWSQSKKCWHFELNRTLAGLLYKQLKTFGPIDIANLKEWYQLREKERTERLNEGIELETVAALRLFEDWMTQRRYSSNTIKNYLSQLRLFFQYQAGKPFTKVTSSDVINYNNLVIIQRNLSTSFQRNLVGSIKLFYQNQVSCDMDLDRLNRPFKENRLPQVLSKQEVEKILKQTKNLKHKALLSITYACGMRRGEVLNLKTDRSGQRPAIDPDSTGQRAERPVCAFWIPAAGIVA
jgi:integrase/recombinase XerD